MRTTTKNKSSDLPGQISFTILTTEGGSKEIPKEKPKKQKTTFREAEKEKTAKRNQVPVLEKEIPEEMYQSANQLLEGYYRMTAGILVNHLRISANQALSVMSRMQKEGPIAVDGKRISHKGKNWKEK